MIMDIPLTKSAPTLKSNLPRYWVFSLSFHTALNSVSHEQRSELARFIKISIKKSWPRCKTCVKVAGALHKPVLKVCGMIWTSEDVIIEDMTVENLQTRIERQAKRLKLEIVDEKVPAVLELELLSDKVKAGNWAVSSITDLSSIISSFAGDIYRFVDLIIVSTIN
jgi:hypothetical protein